jgi:hypothetical protein
MGWVRLRPRSSRSWCSTASISGARGAFPPLDFSQAARNASASLASPATVSRCSVSRTVDDATLSRRAISLPTPRRSSTEALRAHGDPLCWHRSSPTAEPKERTLSGPAKTPPIQATSSRNGGRNHLGTPSEILGFANDFPRYPQRGSPARQSRIPFVQFLVGYLGISDPWAALSPLE